MVGVFQQPEVSVRSSKLDTPVEVDMKNPQAAGQSHGRRTMGSAYNQISAGGSRRPTSYEDNGVEYTQFPEARSPSPGPVEGSNTPSLAEVTGDIYDKCLSMVHISAVQQMM